MSWGIDFKADVFIRNKSFSNKYQVESEIEDNEDTIAEIEKRISMMVMAQPSSILNKDELNDPVFSLSKKCKDEMDCYRELVSENVLLSLLLDNWEEYEKDKIESEKKLKESHAE